jgi:N-acetylneuraminic acid mutarotase
MKRAIIILLLLAAAVYGYYWHVHGINLLKTERDGDDLMTFALAENMVRRPGGYWMRAAPMPTPRGEVTAAALGEEIYVIGGRDGMARTVSTVEVFNARDGSWRAAAPLPEPEYCAASASYGGKIYVFGGLRGWAMSPSRNVFIFDPTAGSWRKGPDMQMALGASAIAVHEDTIHIFGGRGLSGTKSVHLAFDPLKEEWINQGVEEMVSVRDSAAAASLGRQVCVMGGRGGALTDNLATVECLHEDAGEWDAAQPLPSARSSFSAAVAGGMICSFGGETPTVTLDRVDCLDGKSGAWQKMTPMPTARHGFGLVEINGLIFAIGGGKRPGWSVTDLNQVFVP